MAPGTVPLPNPKGTSRKACLENPDSLCRRATQTKSRDFILPVLFPPSPFGFRRFSGAGRHGESKQHTAEGRKSYPVVPWGMFGFKGKGS